MICLVFCYGRCRN